MKQARETSFPRVTRALDFFGVERAPRETRGKRIGFAFDDVGDHAAHGGGELEGVTAVPCRDDETFALRMVINPKSTIRRVAIETNARAHQRRIGQ
jgi:hypothetical protein